MKKLSLLFPALALAGLVTAQSHKFEWVHGTGSSGAENTHSVATDKDGNIYTSGRFRNSFDFDPGPGTSTLTAVSTYYDIFVSKFDKDGNFVWVKQLGGSGVKTDAYLTLDTANNIYLAGAFNGKIDLDPGAGIFEMTADTTQEMFVAKYNQDGDFIWAKQMGGYNSYSTPKAIATDDFGNVYTTGAFIDTVDFDPGAGLFPLHTAGGQDFYISKLDKDGGFVWAKSCGYADSITTSFSIAADGLGNTYTVGSFTGIVDFDPGAGVSELSAVRPQTFILKLDIAGDFAWARQVENKSSAPRPSNTSRSVTIDKSGDVYVAGNFMGAADFDPGVAEEVMTADSLDAYVLKLSKDGDF
ncbi:MAG: SBBP repeat-containing protein, partial [Chitinophagaceae bacterium]|nr:SBBP repeat-containing protein [Chitinophagaceae bacterium]